MNRTNYMLQIKRTNTIRQITILVIVLIVVLLVAQNSLIQVSADDDDDDEDDDNEEDLSKSLGWAAVGLFAVSSVYIAFYQTYRFTRRLSKEGRKGEIRKFIGNVFLKVRKPLLYTHYFSGLAALIVLLIHGVMLTKDDAEAVIGWVAAGVYILFIITGIILWFKIKPIWVRKKLRKTIFYIHRSLLIFIIIIAIHIAHLVIAD